MRLMLSAAAAVALMTAPALATAAAYGGADNTTAATAPNSATTATAPNSTTTATAPNSTTTATAPTDASNPAIKTTEGNNPGAPAAGANSFTMNQAKARIEARGYGQVSGLQKDKEGLWRGKAMKDGKAVNVALDFQGNVVTN